MFVVFHKNYICIALMHSLVLYDTMHNDILKIIRNYKVVKFCKFLHFKVLASVFISLLVSSKGYFTGGISVLMHWIFWWKTDLQEYFWEELITSCLGRTSLLCLRYIYLFWVWIFLGALTFFPFPLQIWNLIWAIAKTQLFWSSSLFHCFTHLRICFTM